MYADFASEHSPKWSSGKLPLSGGRGGADFCGAPPGAIATAAFRERTTTTAAADTPQAAR